MLFTYSYYEDIKRAFLHKFPRYLDKKTGEQVGMNLDIYAGDTLEFSANTNEYALFSTIYVGF
jgi:hypothetical protein